MSQTSLVDLEKFNIKNFYITEFVAETEKNKAMLAKQKIAYPRYKSSTSKDGNTPQLKTGEIVMTSGGMTPKIDKLTGKPIEEKDRLGIRIPLDLEQESCKQLHGVLEAIDQYIISMKDLERKAGVNGLNLKDIVSSGNPAVDKKNKIYPISYAYTSIVRSPAAASKEYREKFEKDNGVDYDPELHDKRPQYIKAKIPVDFKSGEIKTVVFVVDPITKKRSKVPITCVDDIAKYLTWKSTVRFVLTMPKLWLQKQEVKGVASFGIGINIIQMLITPAENSKASSEFSNDCAFSDEDDTSILASNLKTDIEEDRIVNDEEEEEKATPEDSTDEDEPVSDEEQDTDSDEESDDEPVVVQGKGKAKAKRSPSPPPKKKVNKRA